MEDSKGLILTVGLKPIPIIFAIKDFNPSRVVFIGTPKSIDVSLDEIIEKTGLKPSKYIVESIEDKAENIGVLVNAFYKGFKWLVLNNIAQDLIRVDPTYGKKWMSSGAIMAASFLGLEIIYVDVELDEKWKPILDTMKVVPLGNAYDQTGFIAAEQGRTAFNKAAFDNAEGYFSKIRPSSSFRADFFKGLAKLSNTLAKWDRFEHYDIKISDGLEEAIELLKRSFQSGSGTPELGDFLNQVEILKDSIVELEAQSDLKPGFIIDVYLNAKRRFNLHRYDDSVGRLYRTLEAVSQYFLKVDYDIVTTKPDYEKLPNVEEIREQFRSLGIGELPQKLDLNRSYILLRLLGHDLGNKTVDIKKSQANFRLIGVLEKRNSSILAHGFKPIGKENAEKFIENIEKFILKTVLESEYELWSKKLAVPTLPELGV